MKIRIFFTLWICWLIVNPMLGQFQAQFSGNIDFVLQKGGKNSHYYINGVHLRQQDWHFSPLEANLITKINFSEQWFVNGRIQMEKDEGYKFEQVRLSQLNINWIPKDQSWHFTAGRFITPFGSFNQKQRSINRTFIDVPLAYGYFTNISPYVGYAPGLGDTSKIRHSNGILWGLPLSYYNGYSSGLKAKYIINPNLLSAEVALVSAAPLEQKNLRFSPLNYAVIGRLSWQPKYFWKQGFSASYGTFFRENEAFNASLDRKFKQLMLGTDFKLGFGYFEISGELVWASHQVPWYLSGSKSYLDADPAAPPYFNMNSWSAYLDIRYEFSFLPGSYLACRLDTLQFGEVDTGIYTPEPWDNRVNRVSFALGIQPQPYLLIRLAYASQEIKSFDGELSTFKTTLTAFF